MYSSLQGFDVDMHGDGLDSVGRPSKRSRGWQQQAEMEQEQHQQHQQHMHHSAAESSNSRSQRMDAPPAKHPDKERGRLLSCRECRRSVCLFSESSFFFNDFFQTKTQGKFSLVLVGSIVNPICQCDRVFPCQASRRLNCSTLRIFIFLQPVMSKARLRGHLS